MCSRRIETPPDQEMPAARDAACRLFQDLRLCESAAWLLPRAPGTNAEAIRRSVQYTRRTVPPRSHISCRLDQFLLAEQIEGEYLDRSGPDISGRSPQVRSASPWSLAAQQFESPNAHNLILALRLLAAMRSLVHFHDSGRYAVVHAMQPAADST